MFLKLNITDSAGLLNLLKLFKYIGKSNRKKLFFLSIFLILGGFADAINIASVLPFLTILTNPEKINQIYFVKNIFENFNFFNLKIDLFFTILFLSSIFFSGILRLFNLWFINMLSALIGNELGSKAISKTLMQPYEVHIQRNSSLVINTAISETSKTVNAINFGLNLISSIFVSLTIFLIITIIDYKIAFFASILFGCCYLLIILKVKKRLKINSFIITQEGQKRVKSIQEGLGSIRDLILQKKQSYFSSIYHNSDLTLRKLEAQNQFLGNAPKYVLETLGIAFIGITGYLLVKSNQGDLKSVPYIGTFAIAAQKLLPSMQLVYASWVGIRANNASIKKVIELLKQKSYTNKNEFEKFNFEKISLKNISFKYKGSKQDVFKKINLEINKGEKIGIMGKSGIGKSTLIDMIAGLLSPTEGELLVNSLNIKHINNINFLERWRNSISFVPQQIFLIDDSIKMNIALGINREEIDMNRVIKASRIANIDVHINELPDRYNTKVGERGVKLSGGQIQRIGLARALYKNNPFLILDEATSALDANTEKKVIKSINEFFPDLTMIIIAHRKDTLDYCDSIIFMEDLKK